jgi:hypothetical protein
MLSVHVHNLAQYVGNGYQVISMRYADADATRVGYVLFRALYCQLSSLGALSSR